MTELFYCKIIDGFEVTAIFETNRLGIAMGKLNRPDGSEEYATWQFNIWDDEDYSWGHYGIPDLEAAKADFVSRAFPDQEVG